MAILSKEDFNFDLPKKDVSLMQYGYEGSVLVRALTAAEEGEIFHDDKSQHRAHIEVAYRTILDYNSKQLFTKAEVEKLRGDMVRNLAVESMRMSGLIDDEDEEEKKD